MDSDTGESQDGRVGAALASGLPRAQICSPLAVGRRGASGRPLPHPPLTPTPHVHPTSRVWPWLRGRSQSCRDCEAR